MYLNCHSYHSLRYGTISVEDLVRDSARLGISALALTDINTITGIYDFYKLCKEFGIKPIVGVDVRLDNQQYNLLCFLSIFRVVILCIFHKNIPIAVFNEDTVLAKLIH